MTGQKDSFGITCWDKYDCNLRRAHIWYCTTATRAQNGTHINSHWVQYYSHWLNFTILHGIPKYTICSHISVQPYVVTRFLNGGTWCNLSCPWFEWIFKMSMNKSQLPINGIIKFRKILQKFWKILKILKTQKIEFFIFLNKENEIISCQDDVSIETFPSSEHPDTFGFEQFYQ